MSNANADAECLGLQNNHAYTITKICRFKITKGGGDSNTETLVRIRNPWGEKEWIGSWSDYSDEMKSLKPSISTRK